MRGRIRKWIDAYVYVHPLIFFAIAFIVCVALIEGGVITFGHNRTLDILVSVVAGLQFATGCMLIFITLYLQRAMIEGVYIPRKYRWPPFVVGVFILDGIRGGTLVPFSELTTGLVMYLSVLYLAYNWFLLVLVTYDVETPYREAKSIAQRVRKVLRTVARRQSDSDPDDRDDSDTPSSKVDE